MCFYFLLLFEALSGLADIQYLLRAAFNEKPPAMLSQGAIVAGFCSAEDQPRGVRWAKTVSW